MKQQPNIDPIEQHVIDLIIKLRLSNKLRQCDISKIINVTPSFVGNVENKNNPAKYNLKHINMLANYFNLSPKSFMPDKVMSTKAFQDRG